MSLIATPSSSGLRWRAGVVLALTLALLLGAVGFVLYARGWFEPTQRLVLVADDSEGVTVGMDVTFAGFAIGRVERIGLHDDGQVRIEVSVPLRDAKWLRTSSIFTMERSLVGSTKIRAYSGVLDDPALPDGAERTVLRGDAMADIPRLVSMVREVLDNVNQMTRPDAPINRVLQQSSELLARSAGPDGAMAVLMGPAHYPAQVKRLSTELSALMASLQATSERTQALLGDVQQQVSAPGGITDETKHAVTQVQQLLRSADEAVRMLQPLLADLQVVGQNAKTATADLGPLRADIEAGVRRLQDTLRQLQSTWPLAPDAAQQRVNVP